VNRYATCLIVEPEHREQHELLELAEIRAMKAPRFLSIQHGRHFTT
jgi:hypothetical protein